MRTGRVRVGILAGAMVVPAWHARAIEHLLAADSVDLALVVLSPDASDQRGRSRGDRRDRVWHTFEKYVARRSAALRPVDLSHALHTVPSMHCSVEPDAHPAERFCADDVELIRATDLDVLLHLGFGVIDGPILKAARYGVWAYHLGGVDCDRDVPPCFSEISSGEPVVGAVLERLSSRSRPPVVLEHGWFRAHRHSYVQTLDNVCFGGCEWPAKLCAEIARGASPPRTPEPNALSRPGHVRTPSNLQTLRFLRRLTWTWLETQAKAVFLTTQWNPGVVNAPIHHFLDSSFVPVVEWLPKPASRSIYRADPFGLINGSEPTVILLEEFDYRTGVGRIRAIDKVTAQPRATMPIDEHASYPFLLLHGGTVYCIPQIERACGVRLFQSVEWPHRWEEVGTIIKGVDAIDPSIVAFEGRWWMFFGVRPAPGLLDLHIWHADDLLGEWQPHAANPVKADVRSTRPGGTPFVHEGTLYRPAQDCSSTYGHSVVINRIVSLTPDEFREEPVVTVGPIADSPWSRGMHTLSSVGPHTFVDGKRMVFCWPETKNQLGTKLRRIGRRGRDEAPVEQRIDPSPVPNEP